MTDFSENRECSKLLLTRARMCNLEFESLRHQKQCNKTKVNQKLDHEQSASKSFATTTQKGSAQEESRHQKQLDLLRSYRESGKSVECKIAQGRMCAKQWVHHARRMVTCSPTQKRRKAALRIRASANPPVNPVIKMGFYPVGRRIFYFKFVIRPRG